MEKVQATRPRGPTLVAWMESVPPVVPSRGYASEYRERKLAAHNTRRGVGRVGRALRSR